MFSTLNSYTQKLSAFLTVGFLTGATEAHAAVGGNNFSDIARNINSSIEELPGLLTSISYLAGLLFGVLGIMKIKDHVENPSNTQLKDGAIRLTAGGALFSLPIVFEAMQSTIGTGTAVQPAPLNPATFNVN